MSEQSIPISQDSLRPAAAPEDYGNNAEKSSTRKLVYFFPGCILHRSDGCHFRALETLDFLLSEGFDITFYSFRNHSKWPWTPERISEFESTYPSVRLVCEDINQLQRLWTSARNFLFRYAPAVAMRLAHVSLPGITPRWREISNPRHQSIFWLNYADAITYLNGIGGPNVIVDTHDLMFHTRTAWSGKHPRSPYGLQYLRKELSQLALAAKILAINPAEYEFLSIMLGTECETLYLPPRLNIQPTPLRHTHETDLLFVGSDNQGNIKFLNQFLSEFITWNLGLKLTVAGRVSSHVEGRFRQRPEIRVLGYVRDLRALYSETRAACCPVEGTGVNIKIIDAVNHGKVVFASSKARKALSPEVKAVTFPLTKESLASTMASTEALEKAEAEIARLANFNDNNLHWSTLGASLKTGLLKAIPK